MIDKKIILMLINYYCVLRSDNINRNMEVFSCSLSSSGDYDHGNMYYRILVYGTKSNGFNKLNIDLYEENIYVYEEILTNLFDIINEWQPKMNVIERCNVIDSLSDFKSKLQQLINKQKNYLKFLNSKINIKAKNIKAKGTINVFTIKNELRMIRNNSRVINDLIYQCNRVQVMMTFIIHDLHFPNNDLLELIDLYYSDYNE